MRIRRYRRHAAHALVVLASTLLVGAARAATLPVDASLSFTIGAIGNVVSTGSGTSTSESAFGLLSVPAGLVAATTTQQVLITPPVLALSKITLAPFQNEAGVFDPGGDMGNDGVANLFFTNGQSAGALPLHNVGGGAIAMGKIIGQPVTIVGALWTNLGVTTADPTRTITIMNAAAGIPITITASAFDRRTANGQGEVQLVAPARVRLFDGNLGNLPVVGVLTLSYAPEPGTLLLVGGGLAGLLALRRGQRVA